MAGVSIRINQARLAAELRGFLRTRGPNAIDRAVRATAFQVGGDIIRSLNGAGAGFSAPKRIDTGRYRAGWAIGVQQATGRAVGSTVASPVGRDGRPNPQQADDGRGIRTRTAFSTTVRAENNVEYGPYIEGGTATMRPGHHVALAMLRATVKLREALGREIPQAWRDQLGGT